MAESNWEVCDGAFELGDEDRCPHGLQDYPDNALDEEQEDWRDAVGGDNSWAESNGGHGLHTEQESWLVVVDANHTTHAVDVCSLVFLS